VTRIDAYFDADEYDEDYLPPSLMSHPTRQRRAAGARPRPPKPPNPPVAEPDDGADDFTTTYKPARYEKVWLRESLATFYEQQIVVDVVTQIKGGKEANVYRCQAHPAIGQPWLAAKVYRPRRFRNLSNDKMYRDGRTILTARGTPVKETDHRIMRALGKKTAFGVQVQHTSWLMHEYTTMELLRRAGAAVPEPVAASDNAVLMSYHGDESMAAPPLNTVGLERAEAVTLFAEVMRNVELMLSHGLIHGDLSAYNILYWQGAITLIDFPQVTHSQTNSNAFFILRRDITRVCEYFAAQGESHDPLAITETLWQRYMALDPDDAAADASRLG
jgi:RIO kinase 1